MLATRKPRAALAPSIQSASMPLPQAGSSVEQIIAELEAMRSGDVRWRDGRAFTLTYYAAEKVVPKYNVMGIAKSALEASVRYLAYEMGKKGVRVNAVSAGPVRTVAARMA